jgi:UDPglucose 6-dehydrogenase
MNNAVVLGGLGVVGMATRKSLGIDKYFDIKGSNISLEEASNLRYVFICLPTPVRNGRYEMDDITAIIRQMVSYDRQNVFIIRSTVYPGYAAHIMKELKIHSIVSNPEFLTMDTIDQDISKPDLILIGGAQENYINDVLGIWKERYVWANIIKTDNTTAELAKLAINSFYATKVVFANQIYDFAEKMGANYQAIKEIMYARKWIGKNHLEVWHKGGRGAGGRCLPKDLEALAEYSQLPLLEFVRRLNMGLLALNRKERE